MRDKDNIQKIFSKNLKELLSNKGVTQLELSKYLGVSNTTVYNYVNGFNMPRMDKIDKICEFFNISRSALIESNEPNSMQYTLDISQFENIIPIKNSKTHIPLIGTIAAGRPILADEHIEEYIDLKQKINADFALRVKGDSMINANIRDGDIVFIRKQSDVDDGEIAAVLIDDSATLKRVFKIGDIIQLRAENSNYAPINLDESNNVLILGKAVYRLSKI